jgi:uncharacterized membrane protein
MSKRNKLRRIELEKVERRKKELLSRKKRMKKVMAMSVILIASISILIVVSMANNTNSYEKNNESIQSSDIISETEVGIPISDIGDNAKFYSYDANGVEVKYFAVRGPDGDIHVAFDACDVCYQAKKGYRQSGDIMQCLNCGKQYPINSCGTENLAGGCWPSYLPMSIKGENVIIEKSDLEQKNWMFL